MLQDRITAWGLRSQTLLSAVVTDRNKVRGERKGRITSPLRDLLEGAEDAEKRSFGRAHGSIYGAGRRDTKSYGPAPT